MGAWDVWKSGRIPGLDVVFSMRHSTSVRPLQRLRRADRRGGAASTLAR